MTQFLIIADWGNNFAPTRTAIADTEEAAQTLVNKLVNELPESKRAPNAFYVPNPDVGLDFVVVDPVNKTISIDTIKAVKETALAEIDRLEALITPRRLRDAIAGTEQTEGWLASQETLIATQRSKLGGGDTSDYEPEGIASL